MARFPHRLAGSTAALALTAAFGFTATPAFAEEGMWTFDNVPFDKVEQSIGVKLDQAWLDKVRKGAARMAGGCSSSIVSGEGLVQTNYHCVIGCLQDISSAKSDHVKNGIIARSRAEETSCPGMAIEVLTDIRDVTADITQATEGKQGEAFTKARDAKTAELEKACKGDATDKRCQLVSLYQGGQYKLYTYKRYNDARIVFSPEGGAQAFGGDPDNFNFPRYSLDVAFVRLYENGKPAVTPDHLKWRSEPLTDGEPVFIAGNPGSTGRQLTQAQLAFRRDQQLPWRLDTLSELRGIFKQFMTESPESYRQGYENLFGIENAFKGNRGRRLALVDAKFQEWKAKDEADLKAKGAPEAAYKTIADATATYQTFWLPYTYIEGSLGSGSSLLSYARTLLRAADERAKPDAERLPGFTEARLPVVERGLLAERPIEAPVEEIQITFWASKLREYLTADDPLVKLALGKESPEQVGARIAKTSKLASAAERKRLWEGGKAAIDASKDPAIELARRIDAEARKLRQRYDQEVDGPITRAQEQIAKARFQAYGDTVYPDATFTLRLTWGKVAGWSEPSGREVEPFTRLAGLYERATGAFPYIVEKSWERAKAKLDPDTIYNVSTTHDIIGGNSGSPLIDKDGRVVGAVFDGNIHSLGGDFWYEPVLNRSVSVASTAIEEALLKVYDFKALVDELKR